MILCIWTKFRVRYLIWAPIDFGQQKSSQKKKFIVSNTNMVFENFPYTCNALYRIIETRRCSPRVCGVQANHYYLIPKYYSTFWIHSRQTPKSQVRFKSDSYQTPDHLVKKERSKKFHSEVTLMVTAASGMKLGGQLLFWSPIHGWALCWTCKSCLSCDHKA